jgi:hypothetical protein
MPRDKKVRRAVKDFSDENGASIAISRMLGCSVGVGEGHTTYRTPDKVSPGMTTTSLFRRQFTAEGNFVLSVNPNSTTPMVYSQGAAGLAADATASGFGGLDDYVYVDQPWFACEMYVDGNEVRKSQNIVSTHVPVYRADQTGALGLTMTVNVDMNGTGVEFFGFDGNGNELETAVVHVSSGFAAYVFANASIQWVGAKLHSESGSYNTLRGFKLALIGDVYTRETTHYHASDVFQLPFERIRFGTASIFVSETSNDLINQGNAACGKLATPAPANDPDDVQELLGSRSLAVYTGPAKEGLYVAAAATTLGDRTFRPKSDIASEGSDTYLMAAYSGRDAAATCLITVEIVYEIYGTSPTMSWSLPPVDGFELVERFHTELGGAFVSENPLHIKDAMAKAKKFAKHPATRAIGSTLFELVKKLGPAVLAAAPLLL